MKAEKNKVVSLSYVLTVNDEVMETVPAEKPMKFIMGTGYLLPKFEENIAGKSVGDSFEFTLDAPDAYGEIMQEAIVELPKSIFEVDGEIEEGLLTVGNVLPMSNTEGHRMDGYIDEVREDTIVMNFNHPLAGETLHFQGTVVDIREATEDELKNGLYGELRQGGCGSSCGSDDCSSCGS